MDFLEPPLYKRLKLDYLTYKFPKYHKVIQVVVKLGFRSILVLFTGELSCMYFSIYDNVKDFVFFCSSCASVLAKNQ